MVGTFIQIRERSSCPAAAQILYKLMELQHCAETSAPSYRPISLHMLSLAELVNKSRFRYPAALALQGSEMSLLLLSWTESAGAVATAARRYFVVVSADSGGGGPGASGPLSIRKRFCNAHILRLHVS